MYDLHAGIDCDLLTDTEWMDRPVDLMAQTAHASPFSHPVVDTHARIHSLRIYITTRSRQIAHMCGVLEPEEFMPEPLFDDLPEKYQSISYKAFTHSRSLSLEGLGGCVVAYACGMERVCVWMRRICVHVCVYACMYACVAWGGWVGCVDASSALHTCRSIGRTGLTRASPGYTSTGPVD